MGFYIQARFISTEYFYSKSDAKGLVWPFDDKKLNDYPISLFVDYIPSVDELKINPYNMLMIMEPNEFFGLHTFAERNAHHFTCILTWDKHILDNFDNAVFIPHGLSWLKMPYVDSFNDITKKFEVSYLCGVKNLIEGHFLRQKLYKRDDEILIPKQWFYKLPDCIWNEKANEYSRTKLDAKKVCWNESMFHIAIENVKHHNFYTEKILDAFLTKTIPVYYGCSNIDEFFNSKGIITFNNENEAIKICNSLTENDYYDRIDAINENYEIAKSKFYWRDMIRDWIWDFIKINDIKEID